LEHILGVFIELVLADTRGEIWGEVIVDNLCDCECEGGLGVKEGDLLRREWQAKMVHRSRPKRVSVDLISLAKGAGDFWAFVVKVVADIGCNNLSLPDWAWDEDPVVM